MAGSIATGTRIRERRVHRGIKQSDLAASIGISASYLNLIEHNRRRIGGKILNRLAEVLQVEPSVLVEGAEKTLVTSLNEVAAGHADPPGRAEEFAARFPDWARLLGDLHRQNAGLEQSVRTLTDRLAHDPHLAASLHDVISTVTAIRSTASILVETKELEPEWRGRFHRNINEESRRLAEGAEALVRYLEAAPDTEAEIRSPQDELHAFLAENTYHFPALEGGASKVMVDMILEGSGIRSTAARHLARAFLMQYREDALRLPLEPVIRAVGRIGLEPAALAQDLQSDMPMLFRRLATLPEVEIGPVGLVVCDGAGALILRKPLPAFSMPSAGSACSLWPLYQLLCQPQSPQSLLIRQVGRDAQVLRAFAVSQELRPAGFDQPALLRPHMLLLPAPHTAQGSPRDVGVSCRVCPLPACAARREPSIIRGLSDGGEAGDES